MRTDLLGWMRLQWDRTAAWGCVLAGVITLFIGWLGVSGTAFTAKQLPYIAGCGLGGLFLLGTGAMLWLSADLRDEWRKLDRIETTIRDAGLAALAASAVPAADRDLYVVGRSQ
ncbi:hypothetical protein GCM10009547_39510 [Sporichthya brevicatena]|uniref:Uncharacterized protein n=1 Tax=Sporichthya brevicatena TaxID=171442 RepID=A0ABN1H7X2_9ACTN